MRFAWILGLLVACGHPPSPSPDRPNGSATKADAGGPLPTGAPLVTVGERMTYKVSLKGFELASYALEVGTIGNLDGKQAITVSAHAKLAGLAAWFAGKVDDRFTSWIDVITGRSLKFTVDEYASKSKDIEHTTVDIAKRADNVVPVMFHLNNDSPKPEPQKTSLPETWDYNAFVIAMRAWEAPPGTKHSLEVFRSRYLWNVTVTMHGKTKMKVELPGVSELPALRIDAVAFKLRRDGTKDHGQEPRNITLWISDDAGRVPLQINAQTDYGEIVMSLVDYQPGNGDPLRKD